VTHTPYPAVQLSQKDGVSTISQREKEVAKDAPGRFLGLTKQLI
jgi:hypothetical protein